MATNNSVNFANLTTKTTPTTSDIVMIADAAASNVPKQAIIANIPSVASAGFLVGGGMVAAMPGTFSGTTSNTITQTLASLLNSRVFLMPFCVYQTYAMTTIGSYVIAGLAASTMTVGIYANAVFTNAGLNYQYPSGAALGAISIATTANNTLATGTLNLTLTAKTIYWAAIQTSSAVTVSLQAAQMNACCNTGTGIVSGVGIQPQNITYVSAYSAGTLPSITQSSIGSNANTYSPVVLFY